MKDEQYLYSELTDKILKSFYEVYNSIGIGFEKSIYVNSLLTFHEKSRPKKCDK